MRRPSRGPFTTARGMVPLIVVVGFFFATPIVMLGIGSFRNAPPGQAALWSLDAFARTFADQVTYTTFWNSTVLALSSTLLSTALALTLVFFVTRTTARLRKLVTPVMVLVVALPPLFYAMSWGMLGNPVIGMINVWWRDLTQTDGTLFNAYSWTGLITVYVIKGTAFCYLLLLGPFSALDRSLEEAALVSGARRLRTVLGIDLMVLLPAITGVIILNFVIALEGFDVPLFLGTPAGISVFSTQIYGFISDQTPADYGGASVLALFLVALVCVLVWVQWLILGRRRYTTVSGKSYNTAPWDVGAWSWAGTALIALYVVLGVILPFLQLIYGSLQPFFGGGGALSLVNYEQLFSDARALTALQSTFTVALVGGLATMLLAFVIGYAVTHNETRMRRVLEVLTWLPYAVPGIVLALGMSWMFVTLPGFRQMYGSLLLVAVALVVAVVPIAMRGLQPAILQINRELEEAARVSGARPMRVVLQIVLPLILPSFLAGWFVVAIVISGNLAIPSCCPPCTARPCRCWYTNCTRRGIPRAPPPCSSWCSALCWSASSSSSCCASFRSCVRPDGRLRRRRHLRRTVPPATPPPAPPPLLLIPSPNTHRPKPAKMPTTTQIARVVMQRQSKKLVWVALTAAAALALTACQGGSVPGEAPEPPTGEAPASDLELLGSEEMAAELDALYAAAKDAGQTTVTIYGPGETDKAAMYEVFSERFPGITVNAVYILGPDYAAKLEGEFASGQHVADMVQTGDTAIAGNLRADQLVPFKPVGAEGVDAEAYSDAGGTVWAPSASTFGYMYNTNLLDEADAPKGWDDLNDPSLKGKMTSDDVTRNGAGFGTISHLMWDGSHPDWLAGIADQDITLQSSSPVAGSAVATGQYAVHPFYPLAFYIRDKAKGAPVEYVFPTEGGVHLSPHYVGILDGAPNPDAAKLLMAWLFTPEAQQLAAGTGYYPLVSGQAGPEGLPSVDDLDLLKPFVIEDVAGIMAENLAVVKQELAQ